MKSSITDRIERYLKVLIARSEDRSIEIQRAELAETSSCVPSQVTYVLGTRFTERHGYFTESRRGGQGYVRITEFEDEGVDIPQSQLNQCISKLFAEQLLTSRELGLLKMISRRVCQDLPPEYRLKASKAILEVLKDFFHL